MFIIKNKITVVYYENFFQVEYVLRNGLRYGALRFEHSGLGALAMTIALEGLQAEAKDAEVVFLVPAENRGIPAQPVDAVIGF